MVKFRRCCGANLQMRSRTSVGSFGKKTNVTSGTLIESRRLGSLCCCADLACISKASNGFETAVVASISLGYSSGVGDLW